MLKKNPELSLFLTFFIISDKSVFNPPVFVKPEVKYTIPLCKSKKNEIPSREKVRLRIGYNVYEKHF